MQIFLKEGMGKKSIGVKNAEYQFLSLLNAGLWGKNADLRAFAAEPNWDHIMYLARTQAVLPLIYDGIMTLPRDRKPESTGLLALLAYVDKVEAHNRALDAAATEISGRLSSSGIRSVLLKGQGNALLYRNREHRQCGDIDLYVGPDNFAKAAGIIRSWKEIRNEVPESSKHIGYRFGNLLLELHREAFQFPDRKLDAQYREWEEKELLGTEGEKVRLVEGDDREVTLPEAEFNLFYVFAHAFHHFMESGLGLRQMCDLALLIDKYGEIPDSSGFADMLKKYRLDREWKLFVCFLVNVLDLPVGKALLYDPSYTSLSFRLLDRILKDGNFGKHKKLPDFSKCWLPLRKLGSLGIHLVVFLQRVRFSPRQASAYFMKMWRIGLRNALKR